MTFGIAPRAVGTGALGRHPPKRGKKLCGPPLKIGSLGREALTIILASVLFLFCHRGAFQVIGVIAFEFGHFSHLWITERIRRRAIVLGGSIGRLDAAS
jgi:hypothetical protein